MAKCKADKWSLLWTLSRAQSNLILRLSLPLPYLILKSNKCICTAYWSTYVCMCVLALWVDTWAIKYSSSILSVCSNQAFIHLFQWGKFLDVVLAVVILIYFRFYCICCVVSLCGLLYVCVCVLLVYVWCRGLGFSFIKCERSIQTHIHTHTRKETNIITYNFIHKFMHCHRRRWRLRPSLVSSLQLCCPNMFRLLLLLLLVYRRHRQRHLKSHWDPQIVSLYLYLCVCVFSLLVVVAACFVAFYRFALNFNEFSLSTRITSASTLHAHSHIHIHAYTDISW